MAERGGVGLWRDLDVILRRSGEGETATERSFGRLLGAAAAFGAVYGTFVGWHAVKTHGWPGLTQVAAAGVKIPLLFLLTLAVTFPSLYLFAALLDAPLGFRRTLRLLLTAILVTLVAAASFGPILGFFTVSTESYAFMLLLNVALLGGAALIGVAFLLVRLERAAAPKPDVAAPSPERAASVGAAPEEGGADEPPIGAERARVAERARTRAPALEAPPPRGLGLVRVWTLIYALVGVQMAWILRPFLGAPGSDLGLLRPLGGNFFEALFGAVQRLIGL